MAEQDDDFTVDDILDAEQTEEAAGADNGPAAPGASGEAQDAEQAEAEEESDGEEASDHLEDLRRLSAEYANYRKRVDRDREAMNDQAAAAVVGELLPILDDLGRAKEHDEYSGALKSVGDQLETTTTRLGLEAYGAVGDVFDPNIHEAMTHNAGNDLEQPTVSMVFAVGYMFRGRVLRPARVGVEE